ncbi:MAG: GH25 family lysozyme [Clostridia bacterium]|nr:GH25 family lysozyme [Clostridia bacterium]
MLVKNLGGFKALRIRIVFLILAVFITSMPLATSTPEHIKVEEPVVEEVTEAPTKAPEKEDKNVSVALESVEKDIRIGFYDEDGKLVTGYKFEVVVKDVNGNEETYVDNDRDGYIIITGIEPGAATVTPKEAPGCIFTAPEYKINVKDHVEYKPIKNVVVKNDGADTHKATESPKLTDTVKLLDSKIEEIVTYKTLAEAKLTVDNPYPEETTEETSEPEPATAEGETTTETTTAAETTTKPLTTKLLDSTGKNQLYVKDGDDYREATYADYSEDTTFYVKEVEKKYYGWQNIDGKMYYYDENANYVVGTQVIGGVQYNFSQTGVRGGTLGVDVSVYQGNINWAKAKAAGIDFAIIRLGFRGWGSNGSLNIDTKFHTNIAGAKAAGIKVGVYFFSQATTEVEAVEEASLCIKELGGQSLDLPIFIDTETAAGGQGRADNLSVAQRTAVCVAFCNTVRSAGYRAGVYSNKYFFNSKLNTPQLLSYTIWLAEWPSDYTSESKPTYSGRYDIWQFSDSGNGATYGMGSQYVDVNYS